MDIQPVFNEYKAVTYMCQYFSKTEDYCSQAMKKQPTTKEAFENNMNHHETMKIIAKAYLNNRECSVQEAVPVVYFVNTNIPEEIAQVLLPEKKLSKLPDGSPSIFKK